MSDLKRSSIAGMSLAPARAAWPIIRFSITVRGRAGCCQSRLAELCVACKTCSVFSKDSLTTLRGIAGPPKSTATPWMRPVKSPVFLN